MPIILAQAAPPPAAVAPSVVTQPEWLQLPDAAALVRYYPTEAAKNRVEGRATVRCQVNSEGRLADCEVESEDPLGAGFGAAAIDLAAHTFRMQPKTRSGSPVAGGTIRIPIRFALPPVQTAEPAGTPMPTVTAPDWRRKPTGMDVARVYPFRAERSNVEGDSAIRCTVTARGDLDQCAVIAESPPGYGFGEAALKLGKIFNMRPQTKDGVPVSGGTITIPIRFRLPRG